MNEWKKKWCDVCNKRTLHEDSVCNGDDHDRLSEEQDVRPEVKTYSDDVLMDIVERAVGRLYKVGHYVEAKQLEEKYEWVEHKVYRFLDEVVKLVED